MNETVNQEQGRKGLPQGRPPDQKEALASETADFMDTWWASMPADERWLVKWTIQRLREVRSVEDAVRVASQFKELERLQKVHGNEERPGIGVVALRQNRV